MKIFSLRTLIFGITFIGLAQWTNAQSGISIYEILTPKVPMCTTDLGGGLGSYTMNGSMVFTVPSPSGNTVNFTLQLPDGSYQRNHSGDSILTAWMGGSTSHSWGILHGGIGTYTLRIDTFVGTFTTYEPQAEIRFVGIDNFSDPGDLYLGMTDSSSQYTVNSLNWHDTLGNQIGSGRYLFDARYDHYVGKVQYTINGYHGTSCISKIDSLIGSTKFGNTSSGGHTVGGGPSILGGPTTSLVVHPNPTQPGIPVTLELPEKSDANSFDQNEKKSIIIQVTDVITGKIMWGVSTRNGNISVPTETFPPGIYCVRVTVLNGENTEVFTGKLTVTL